MPYKEHRSAYFDTNYEAKSVYVSVGGANFQRTFSLEDLKNPVTRETVVKDFARHVAGTIFNDMMAGLEDHKSITEPLIDRYSNVYRSLVDAYSTVDWSPFNTENQVTASLEGRDAMTEIPEPVPTGPARPMIVGSGQSMRGLAYDAFLSDILGRATGNTEQTQGMTPGQIYRRTTAAPAPVPARHMSAFEEATQRLRQSAEARRTLQERFNNETRLYEERLDGN